MSVSLRPQWEPIALRAGINPETTAFAEVPGTTSPLVATPAARRDSLRDNLENLLAGPEDDAGLLRNRSEGLPNAPAAHTAACAACQGQCCVGGENHAYLRRADLVRYADVHKHGDLLAAVADYVDRVPDESTKDSCVFHGQHGCALARSMRNHICNSMRCSSLVELDATLQEGAESVVAVVLTPDRTSVRRVGVSSATHLAVADLDA